LQAADILGGTEPGEISFDDLGFTYNGKEDEPNANEFRYGTNSSEVRTTLPHLQDASAETFDTSQFLNLTKDTTTISEHQSNFSSSEESKTSSVQSQGLTDQPVPVASASPQQISYSPSVTRQVTFIASRTTQPTTAQAGNQNSNYGVFKIQLPSNSRMLSTAPNNSYILSSHPNIQYVVSKSQNAMVSSTASSASGSILSQAANSVYGTVTTASSLPSQVVSTNPIVLRLGMSPQTVRVSNGQTQQHHSSPHQLPSSSAGHVNAVQNMPIVTSVHSSQTGPTFQEQANKLAALLQSKASQLIAAGSRAIVKVGNQMIDISDPNIAKALAANILQQRMKQQQMQNHSPSQQQGVPCTSVTGANFQGSATARQPSRLSQTAVQHVFTSVSPVQSSTLSTVKQTKGVVGHTTSSENVNQSTPRLPNSGTLVQVAVPKSANSSINRIQIASVNIPIANLNQTSVNALRSSGSTLHRHAITVTTQSSFTPKTVNSTNTAASLSSPRTVSQNQQPRNMVNRMSEPVKAVQKDQLQRLLMQVRFSGGLR